MIISAKLKLHLLVKKLATLKIQDVLEERNGKKLDKQVFLFLFVVSIHVNGKNSMYKTKVFCKTVTCCHFGLINRK